MVSAKQYTNVYPVVLAGGQSRRMGRDKALLQLPDGQTLLQRAQSLLRSLRAPPGVQFLPPLLSGERHGGIADSAIERGPLGGLHAVSEYLQRENTNGDALLIAPVDMPLLTTAELQLLCAAGATSGEKAVCFDSFNFPLWLPLTNQCRNYLKAAEQGKVKASVSALLGVIGCIELAPPAGYWHTNINRPEEFSSLLQVYGHPL